MDKIKQIKDKLSRLLSEYEKHKDPKYKKIIENMITTCHMKISLMEINNIECSKGIFGKDIEISKLYFFDDKEIFDLCKGNNDYKEIIKFIYNYNYVNNILDELGLKSLRDCSSEESTNDLVNKNNPVNKNGGKKKKIHTKGKSKSKKRTNKSKKSKKR